MDSDGAFYPKTEPLDAPVLIATRAFSQQKRKPLPHGGASQVPSAAAGYEDYYKKVLLTNSQQMVQNRTVRALAVGLLAAALSYAQVQNAADAAAGPGSSPIAPGSLAFVSDYYSSTNSEGASVAIRPVGSSTPVPAQVVSVTSTGITFLVPPDVPFGNARDL